MAKVEARQFAVIGMGRFGIALTKFLHENKAEVLAIDSSHDLINEITPYCTQAICADASDDRVLEKIGIKNFDVVIICIGGDVEASIFITLTCKQLGVKQVITKAQNDKHKHVLERIGADLVIFPEEEMGSKLGAMLVKPNMIEVLSLSENFRIIEIITPAKWVNKSLIQLDLRKTEKVSVILIKRGEEIIVTPMADCILEEHDVLVIAGSTNDTERVSLKSKTAISMEK